MCWSTSENPTIEDNCSDEGPGTQPFETLIEGLDVTTRYYVRAYATNDAGTIYGGQRSFTTQSGVPELQTGQADEIRALSAVAQATLGEENGAVVLDWGICYRPAQSPEEEICLSAVQQQLLAGGALREAGDLFAARAASQRQAQAAGRQSRSLSAEAGRPQPSAGPASENLQSGLTAEREQLQQRQPVAVQQRQTPAREQSSDRLPAQLQNRDLPVLQQQNELSGQAESRPAAEILNTADGSFTVQLTNLQADTGYELRAWAVNDAVGVSYGNVVSFTTMDGVPEIESQPAASVTAFSASVESIIEKDGGDPITARGICYGDMPNPDRSDNCIAAGQGLGSFEITLEELNADTQYFVRAYAENRVGVHFGNQISFATNDGLPGITTNPASEIRAFSAITGGTIQPDGEAPVTGRGVCYATIENPTLDDSCIQAGEGEGSFEVELGGLNPDTEYFIRAYAQNERSLGYGNEVSFTTLPVHNLNLTANPPGSGNVSGGGQFAAGVMRIISANPAAGFEFAGWTGDISHVGNPNSATTSITMPASNVNLVANFTPVPTVPTYSLTLTASPSGSGTVSGGGQFAEGVVRFISANPATGFEFVSWTGDTSHVSNPNSATTSITMPASNVNLVANFTTQSNGGWPRDTETLIHDVTNPHTGRTWMDRNLGASRRATSPTDSEAYGDLYQWGRAADGHQKRISATTSNLSYTDSPEHEKFILIDVNNHFSHYDWRAFQNNSFWQGFEGLNNPCPMGYRIPTIAEWQIEKETWVTEDLNGAYQSILKLQVAGSRTPDNGNVINVGIKGNYWSNTVSDLYTNPLWRIYVSGLLNFGVNEVTLDSQARAVGASVRCIKD
ncbi:MAG: hypothetical protein JJU35_03640 [Balneolales bacterium]|nr:hypothetical protein [Balneolales bacterium]